MKKVVSLFLIVAFVGSMLVMTGCFGGDSGGGLLKAFAVVLVIVAITSSGGAAGPAAFAANHSAKPNPAIYSAARVVKSSVRVKITPMSAAGVADTASQIIVPSENLSVDPTTGVLNASYTMVTDAAQYRVEIVATDTTILKGVVTHTSGSETTMNTTCNATSSANALTYEQWVANRGAADKSYQNFVQNASAATSKVAIDTLAAGIQSKFDTAGTGSVADMDLTTQNSGAAVAATTVGTTTLTGTTTPTTTTATYNVTGTWDMVTGSGNRFTATFMQNGTIITGNGPSWTFSGTVTGAQMTLTTSSTSGYSERWDLTATSNSAMSGNWTTIAGTGVGNTGTLSGTKL